MAIALSSRLENIWALKYGGKERERLESKIFLQDPSTKVIMPNPIQENSKVSLLIIMDLIQKDFLWDSSQVLRFIKFLLDIKLHDIILFFSYRSRK